MILWDNNLVLDEDQTEPALFVFYASGILLVLAHAVVAPDRPKFLVGSGRW